MANATYNNPNREKVKARGDRKILAMADIDASGWRSEILTLNIGVREDGLEEKMQSGGIAGRD